MQQDPEVVLLQPSNRRMENFSDGVFAIALTIMTFELKIPDRLALESSLGEDLQFAGLLATYVMSFFVVVNFWTTHHYLIFTLDEPRRGTIWLNNNLLFWITLVPVVSRFLGSHPGSPRAAAAYAMVLLGSTTSFMFLRAHAARICPTDFHRRIHKRALHRSWVFVLIYSTAIPVAFVSVTMAWVCCAMVPPMFVVPIIAAGWRRAAHPTP